MTIEDFVKTMEEVSGLNLKQFRLWYSQAGTPVLTVQDDYDASQKKYRLSFQQKTLATPDQAVKKPFHIPVRMGLLDQKGREIPLQISDEPITTEKVLQVTEETQTFVFENVTERPIPSLLRFFSAPVKLQFPCSNADLQFLFKHDKDPFNRWEAGQTYATRIILELVDAYQHQKPLHVPSEFIEMFEYVLQHDQTDPFLLTEMLLIPSEKYVGEQMEVIDVDAIHAAREFLVAEIANQLQKTFIDIYTRNHDQTRTYHFSVEDIGKRQLKNRCLLYLLLLPQYGKAGMQQFETALSVNMTDTQSALVGLANIANTDRMLALDQFYEKWKHDALVVDKWLSIQAASKLPDTLQTIKKLMKHPAFDIKNPNKVYALIGTFGHRNAIHFHAIDGEGYAFLRETVQQLDKLNPQVASRMAKPLTTWKRYDKERQALMQAQLELLLQDKKLSKDLYELVAKSLGETSA